MMKTDSFPREWLLLKLNPLFTTKRGCCSYHFFGRGCVNFRLAAAAAAAADTSLNGKEAEKTMLLTLTC
jgi:hypothetical protein